MSLTNLGPKKGGDGPEDGGYGPGHSGGYARPSLEAETEIPFLGDGFCAVETIGLGRGPMIVARKIARALPEAAIFAPVNVQLAAEEVAGGTAAVKKCGSFV